MKPIAVDNLRHHCTIGLDDLNYDLCPLVGRTVTIEDTRYTMDADGDRGEGSSNGRRFYDVTLGGLRSKRMVSELCMLLGFLSNMFLQESGCGEDTWVCLRGKYGPPDGPPEYSCVEIWGFLS